jgi:hypoxanthine phosphoribosyltransferase
MKKRFIAQELIQRLNEKILGQLNLRETLILGVVLKGLPIAYSLASMNGVLENFVPLVAQRQMYLEHNVESCFPSLEWKAYFKNQANVCKGILIVDDVVNTGFTKQKVESIVYSLNKEKKTILPQRFAALVLNQRNLANPNFANPRDFYASEVNATNVECDWGTITIPLWDLSTEAALELCEQYYQNFWKKEKRWINIT